MLYLFLKDLSLFLKDVTSFSEGLMCTGKPTKIAMAVIEEVNLRITVYHL